MSVQCILTIFNVQYAVFFLCIQNNFWNIFVLSVDGVRTVQSIIVLRFSILDARPWSNRSYNCGTKIFQLRSFNQYILNKVIFALSYWFSEIPPIPKRLFWYNTFHLVVTAKLISKQTHAIYDGNCSLQKLVILEKLNDLCNMN